MSVLPWAGDTHDSETSRRKFTPEARDVRLAAFDGWIDIVAETG
jgi:hypothetical protein